MLIALGIIIFLGFLGFLIFLVDRFFGGLDFTSGRLVANQVVKIVKDQNFKNGSFYDLGSCRGGFAIRIAKALPNFWVYGIDDSRFRVFCSKSKAIFFKNLKFKKQDIFTADVSSADIIYLYLPQELMPGLQTKLQKELKLGALVISASVSFPSWPPAQVYDLKQAGLKVPKLFVYVKN